MVLNHPEFQTVIRGWGKRLKLLTFYEADCLQGNVATVINDLQ